MSKKHLTSQNIVNPADPVYAQQVNYGQSSLRSVSDVITRHFEDYNELFIEDRIYNGLICSQAGGQDISVSAGNATVKGRWYILSSPDTVTIPTTDDIYYVVIQLSDDGGTIETRNPSSDTFTLTYVTDAGYDSTTDYILAQVTVTSSVISAFEDYGSYPTKRGDYLKPKSGSTIKVFTGSQPNSTTFNTLFSGTQVQNLVDNGGFVGGAGGDFRVYHDATDNIWDNLNGSFKMQFGGTTYYTLTSGTMVTELNQFTLNDNSQIGITSQADYLSLDTNEFVVDNNQRITGDLSVSGTTIFSGVATFKNDVYFEGTTTLSGAFNLSGTAQINNATITGSLTILGDTYFSGNLISNIYSGTEVNLSSLTASRLIASDADKNIVSVSNLASWISGTTNQNNVTNNGDGTITISSPQDIHTSATPTFSIMTLSVASGTAPLTITSPTVVTNLNADLLDGKHAPSGDIVGLTDAQTLTNKTLTSPIIADYTNANHTHSGASQGGDIYFNPSLCIYAGVSSTVTASESTPLSSTQNSIDVLSSVAIPFSVFSGSDFKFYAGVEITAFSEVTNGVTKVGVDILKGGSAWLSSSLISLSSTGFVYIPISVSGVSLSDDYYTVRLIVSAGVGDAGSASVTARLNSVIMY